VSSDIGIAQSATLKPIGEIAARFEPLEKAGDRHVVQHEQAVEGDAVAALQCLPPLLFERRLRRAQKGAGRIGNQC
jgi:hypothetical protein